MANRLRYSKTYAIGAGDDALNVALSIDIVDFPYTSQAVTSPPLGDTTTLAGVGVEVSGGYGVSFSSNDVPAESQIANTSIKIYDTSARAAWSALSQGLPSNKRIQIVLWRQVSGTWKRFFHGSVDKSSIKTRVKSITSLQTGQVYDSEITFNAGGLEKTVLQDYTVIPCQQIYLFIAFWTVTGGYFQIECDGETTGHLAYNITPAAMLSALQALPIHGKYFLNVYPNKNGHFINENIDTGYNILINSALLYQNTGSTSFAMLNFDATPITPGVIAPYGLNLTGVRGNIPRPWFGNEFSGSSSVGQPAPPLNFISLFPYFQPVYYTPSEFIFNWQLWNWVSNNQSWTLYSATDYSYYLYNGTRSAWSDWNFTNFTQLIVAFVALIAAATDLPAATPNIDLTHIGVTVRTPGASPSVTQWGAGASGTNAVNLHNVMAFNKHIFIDWSDVQSDRQYNLTKCSTLYEALKSVCENVLCIPLITFDETSGVTMNIRSPLSANNQPLVSGNPLLIPCVDTLDITSFVFNIDEVNEGVAMPPESVLNFNPQNLESGVYVIYGQQVDDTASPFGNTTSCALQVATAHDGSNVGGSSMYGSFMVLLWWSQNSGTTPGYILALPENNVEIFDVVPGSPAKVYTPDSTIYDNPPGTFYPYSLPFAINQGWGGGTLGGGEWNATTAYISGNTVTKSGITYICILANTNQMPPNATYWSVKTATLVNAATWQQNLVLGLASLFCVSSPANPLQNGAEKVEFEVPWTVQAGTNLITLENLIAMPLWGSVNVQTDAPHNFLIIGVEFNPFDVNRTAKITAIRNYND